VKLASPKNVEACVGIWKKRNTPSADTLKEHPSMQMFITPVIIENPFAHAHGMMLLMMVQLVPT
jgi:hypothetical protein